MNRKRLAIVLVVLLLLAGCAGKQVAGTNQPSPEAVAYKAISVAFDAYDLGMTSLAAMHRGNLISTSQFEAVKKKVVWPLYTAILAAEAAAQEYALAPAASKESVQGNLTKALEAVATAQKEFTKAVGKVQEGK